MRADAMLEKGNLDGYAEWRRSCAVAGSNGPWFNTNGEMVATSLADLHDPARGRIHASLKFDEAGLQIGGGIEDVWTGTLEDGTGGGAYCGDWTSGLAGDSGVQGSTEGASLNYSRRGLNLMVSVD